MFLLDAEKIQLTVRAREPVTSGSVNVYEAQFAFSEDWTGLERTAVFKAGTAEQSVPLDDSGRCVIPPEVLKTPGLTLKAGICGTREDEIVLPTIWARLGVILEGAAASGAADSSLPEQWEQALAKKGDGLAYDGLNLSLTSDGDPLSTVQIAGGTGSEPGPAGPQGQPGQSAYEIAAEHGFSGTEEAWLASLQGPPGPPGPAGSDAEYRPGNGIAFAEADDGGTAISVETPVRVLNKAAYDALPEEAKAASVCFLPDAQPSGGNASGEIHSTEEQVIGTWIDGRPLYRQYISGVLPDTLSPWRWQTIFEIPNLDFPVELSVYVEQDGFPKWVKLNGASATIGCNTDGGVCLFNTIAGWGQKPFYGIITYTKTTDEAVNR